MFQRFSCFSLTPDFHFCFLLSQFLLFPRNDFPILQPYDPVAAFQRAQPVGDGDDGQRPLQPVDGFHHREFRLVVQRAGGLVQYQHLRAVIQRAGQPDALALPAGKPHAPLADGGLKSLRQFLFDEVEDLRAQGRLAQGRRVTSLGPRQRRCSPRCCRPADKCPAARSRSSAATTPCCLP